MELIGIAIACFMQIDGATSYVKGTEVGQINDNIVFVPDSAIIPAAQINNNDCNYLEEPVAAYQRVLRQRQDKRMKAIATKAIQAQEAKKWAKEAEKTGYYKNPSMLQKIGVSRLPMEALNAEPAQPAADWCLVDGYEVAHCAYVSMSACIKAMKRQPKDEYCYCKHKQYLNK